MKSLREALNPPEPEMPDDVAEFIKTEFGKKVHEYYMAELSFIVMMGYKEAHEMIKEERDKVFILESKLKEKNENICCS